MDMSRDITSFYSLFSSKGNMNFSECPNWKPRKFTDRKNSDMRKPLLDEEIKEAAFQLGALKAPGRDGFSGIFCHILGCGWVRCVQSS